jgi:hypothetical protein
MAKIKTYIIVICIISLSFWGVFTSCDRDISNNVNVITPVEREVDTVITDTTIIDTTTVPIDDNIVEPDTIIPIDTIVFDLRTSVLDTLISYLGVKELTGNNDGEIVEKFIASTGLNPKGKYAWCAAYITYAFKENGLDVPKYPARARSWFEDDLHNIPNDKAIEGDLGSLYYNNLNRIGHIFAYTKPYLNSTPYVATIEGNTNAQGSREGNQVAKRFRPRGTVYSSSNWIDK